uniref:Uncharacterized protein n=1 Tax=Cacopsylla melanoneura TaxID=428564 RepID=A0A8D8VDJ3_9HEMI
MFPFTIGNYDGHLMFGTGEIRVTSIIPGLHDFHCRGHVYKNGKGKGKNTIRLNFRCKIGLRLVFQKGSALFVSKKCFCKRVLPDSSPNNFFPKYLYSIQYTSVSFILALH